MFFNAEYCNNICWVGGDGGRWCKCLAAINQYSFTSVSRAMLIGPHW